MYSDAEIEQAGKEYEALHWPFHGMRFYEFLRLRSQMQAPSRPTHFDIHIHWEEKGGPIARRIAVAIRRAAGRRPSR